ncbi:hypothetical protein E8F11_22870 [Pseudomonas sp. BN417]|uniref:hypothetical protein n=1 Tax=Pseudomonas sp. BN417 TaxID=2567890 RepID=UPI0024551387|nr:hypothetical protein [Pseudomonas sp. BN417]MDH4557982.1 hypothetical protein [Pseudomonas sp. BN417]
MAISSFGDSDDDAVSMPQAPARVVSSFGDEADDALVQPQGVQRVGRHQLPQTMTQDHAPTALGDVGRGLLRGVGGAAQAGVGIADILSGGAAGQLAEQSGYYNPRQADARLNQQDTPELQQARRELEQAQGFTGTIQSVLGNPRLITEALAQAAPSMLLGGGVGRGVVAAGQLAGRAVPAIAAAGIGEGAVSAGQQAEQTRQTTGGLTAGQAGLAVGAGALTGLLGAAGARLGRAMGIADIDAQLAGVDGVNVAKGLVNRVLAGAGIESIEELSQSAQEQVLGNIAQGRQPMEGVGQAAAMGGVVGGLMGGAAGLRRPAVGQPVQAPDLVTQQPIQQAQAQAVPSAPMAPQQAASAPAAPAPALAQPAPSPAIPFAASQDISPLLDKLGVQGEQRTQTLDLLRPSEADIEARRRGVLPLDEQRKLADLIGLEGAKAQSLTHQIGQTWNAEQIFAGTDLVRNRLASILDLQQRIANRQATDADKALFVEHIDDYRRAASALMATRAEAGRALAALRRTPNLGQASDIAKALEKAGGADNVDKLAGALGEAIKAGGLKGAGKVLKGGPGLIDFYWRSALLTGLGTHTANFVGNLGMLPLGVGQRYVAAGIGTAKRAVGLPGATTFGEANAYTAGLAGSVLDGLRAATKGWQTGESQNVMSVNLDDIQTSVGLSADPNAPKMQRMFGIPFRALAAGDSLFGTINAGAERYASAHRTALAEKRDGKLPAGVTVQGRTQQLYANPTPEIIEDAGRHAARMTFNSKAGALVQGFQVAKQRMPILGLLAPFTRTPSNIVHTVTGDLARRETYEEFRGKHGQARQEQAVARVLTAASMVAVAAQMAATGQLTGSAPSDEKEREAFYNSGKQPFSVRIGDRWVSYQRLEPFSSWLGLATDLTRMDTTHKDAAEVAGQVMGTFYQNILQKSFMRGLNDFLNALSRPEQYGAGFGTRLGASLVQPLSILSQAASAADPYMRQPEGLTESIMYRTPGLRQQLSEKLDMFGRPVRNPAQGLAYMIGGVRSSEASNDPLDIEVDRLGWAPPEVPTSIANAKKEYPLTAELQREWAQLRGRLLHNKVRQAMASSNWKRLNDDQKRDRLSKLAREARDAVKMKLLPKIVRSARK